MLSKGIKLETFKNKISIKNIKTIYKNLINNKSEVINSLSLNYQYSFKKKTCWNIKKENISEWLEWAAQL